MGYGTDQHIALLVQNDKGTWNYFSFNGVPIYDTTKGYLGGGSIDNMGEKSFANPQAFLDSNYNSYEEHPKHRMSKDEINGFCYSEAFVLPTSKMQDAFIKETFLRAVKEGYNLFTNHCGHAVQKALNSAGIKTYVETYDLESHSVVRDYPYLPGNTFMYIKSNNSGITIYRRR